MERLPKANRKLLGLWSRVEVFARDSEAVAVTGCQGAARPSGQLQRECSQVRLDARRPVYESILALAPTRLAINATQLSTLAGCNLHIRRA